LVRRFQDLAEGHGGWPIFYLVDAEGLPLYVDLGLSVLKVGDDARVSLQDFSLLNGESAGLRAIHDQICREGYRFEIVRSAAVPPLLPTLQAISDAWLAQNRIREKGFSSGIFHPDYVCNFPCAVVRDAAGNIVSFAVLWASANKEDLAVDLVRYHRAAPLGIMDYLLIELMNGGKEQGYRWFNLGVAPFSSIGSHALAPLWHRVGGLIYRQSEHFRNIESLRSYEEKFHPVWRSKYLVCPAGLNIPRILHDIARLIDDPKPRQ
jgi:phosphatidylglycerol lysyltransferase